MLDIRPIGLAREIDGDHGDDACHDQVDRDQGRIFVTNHKQLRCNQGCQSARERRSDLVAE